MDLPARRTILLGISRVSRAALFEDRAKKQRPGHPIWSGDVNLTLNFRPFRSLLLSTLMHRSVRSRFFVRVVFRIEIDSFADSRFSSLMSKTKPSGPLVEVIARPFHGSGRHFREGKDCGQVSRFPRPCPLLQLLFFSPPLFLILIEPLDGLFY